MKDPISHIVVSIHSFVGIGQIEDKLLRIFMRNLKEEKCEGGGCSVVEERELNR